MAQIRVENLHKAFDQFTAVHDSNFTIENGTFFALLGPSGCGKTTTLAHDRRSRAADRADAFCSTARMSLSGALRRATSPSCSRLFALYPHMNVEQNIGFPLKCQGMARSDIRERVWRLRGFCASSICLTSKTSKLSGGDRQRVALGARHGPASEGVSDGRAAGCARCRVPAPDVR